MDGAGHCRLHGIGAVARSNPEARPPTSLHCRLVRRGSASAARTQRHTRRSRRPRPSQHRSTHTAPFSLRKSSHAAPTTFGPFGFTARARRLFLVLGFHPLFGRPFLFATHCATPSRTHARTTHVRARTTDDERRDVRSAGVADWTTARGGVRSVRSPLRRAPLLATPIATPLQGGRPERSSLLYPAERERAQRSRQRLG